MRSVPSRPRRSTAAAPRTISSRRPSARLPTLFSLDVTRPSSLTSKSKSTADRCRARCGAVLDERGAGREVREHVLARSDVRDLQALDAAAPVIGEARAPRRFVAFRLLHRLAQADGELLRIDARGTAHVLV